MKFEKNILTILLVLSSSFVSHSQNLELTYSDGAIVIPLDNTAVTTIDSTSGNVKVTTSNSSTQIGDSIGLQPVGSAPNISFVVTPNGTTSADINATITNEAVYCDKSGLWSNLILSNPPSDFVTSVTETVTSNGTNYTLTCGNSFGKSTNSATVNSITVVSNPVVTIAAAPTSINSGDFSDITWSVTNSPTTCTFTGDWPLGTGTFAPGDSSFPPFTFRMLNITANKTLSVLCDNSAVGDSGTKTATITVNGSTGSSWASCSDNTNTAGSEVAILNGSEDRSLLSTGFGGLTGLDYNGTFNQLFGVNTSPSLTLSDLLTSTFNLVLTQNQYVAAQFNSGSANIQAKIDFSTPGIGSQGPIPNNLTVSISDCPGDLHGHLGQTRCIAEGANTSIFFSDNPNALPGLFCILQKDTTYYLNVVHSTAASNDFQTSDCPSSACGIIGGLSNVVVK